MPPAWRRFFTVYEADESDAAAFRARQLQAVLRLTPVSMLTNLGNAAIVGVVVWRHVQPALVLAWLGLIGLLAVLGLRGWLRARALGPRPRASRRAMRHAALHAGLLGGAWGALPALCFAGLPPDAKIIIGMVVTGMVCAGGFALFNIPGAATAWVLCLGLGSVWGLWHSGLADAAGLAAMMVFYCVVVVYSTWVAARTIGARLMAEARADRQHELIGLLLRDFEDHASDMRWELDAQGCLRNVSQRLASALGIPVALLARVDAARLLRRRVPASAEARAHWDALRERLAAGVAFREQVVTLCGPHGQTWWSLSARPLRGAGGAAQGWRGVAADVTEKHLAHRRLSWLAHNDALTGLVNRNQFREQLQGLLLQGGGAARLAVVLMDLDGFKQVNDTRGHAAGDELLRIFGERLLSVTRHSDTVARLGGDEFVILVRGAAAAEEVEPLLDRLFVALEPVADVLGHSVQLRASAGVALAPQDGSDVDTLMNHADVALYAAKHAGGKHYRFFHNDLAEDGRRRKALVRDLRCALERGEFRLEYQPQIATDGGAVCGFEALLRWHHPERGTVSPAEFVPIAEGAGLMPAIGAWVLREACAEARSWPGDTRISINVSATQLKDEGFLAAVEQAAQGLSPQRVELEITESSFIDDMGAALVTLDALRARGFRIALDDFGTGYSALGYLRKLRFDTLKIDRSFVLDLARTPEAGVILDTILALSRALRMEAVVEGVETDIEARMLSRQGCDAMQGFLFSRPLQPGAVAGFLAGWAGNGGESQRREVVGVG
ncbi:putative bifunctional diguanylate cyclase/phosphodiesterase [Azohydromonas aeria]|uniref:putative bifunctional diguanylate cyclase/phosphodiesterase n=1 Tax=Azohydromonas aeria TaxID=2590212 RepID=UPI0018DFEA27|nr:bifunctional diguanylate cyclase/phosphodiesterase [Azohydromonas aeria]